MHVANYIGQRSRLEALTALECQDQILAVVGGPDFGKSWLLEWLTVHHKASTRVLRIAMDHPQRTPTPRSVMMMCAEQLNLQHFEAFRLETLGLPVARAVIQDVSVQGNNNVITAAASGGHEDQLALAAALTHSCAEGLRNAAAARGGPIIICLDGLRRDDWLCIDWLEVSFLGKLQGSGLCA